MSQILGNGDNPAGLPTIDIIAGDTGSATPVNDIVTFNALSTAGASVSFSGSGSTISLNTSDANFNTNIGYLTGNISGSAFGNVSLGYNSFNVATTASYNVSVGLGVFNALKTGRNNIGIGEDVGQAYTGAESGNILLNSFGVLGDSNTVRIGQGNGGAVPATTKVFITGINGVNVSSSTLRVATMTSGSDQLGTATIVAGQGMTVTPAANTITLASQGAAAGSLQYFSTSGGSSFPGYIKCDGSIVSQATYTALYAQIGLLNGPDTQWTINTTAPLQLSPSAIGTGNGINLVGFIGGGLETTTDFITWSQVISSTASTIQCMTYGTVYVIGTTGGGISTSTDSITWTSRTSNTAAALSGLASNGSGYVYVGSSGAAPVGTSTDGTTWVVQTHPFASSVGLNPLSYGGGKYILCGNNTLGECSYATSTDGITWVASGSSIGTTLVNGAFAFGNSTFVSAGVTNATIISTSTDAKFWTTRTPGTSSTISALVYGTTFVYAGAGGVLATSTDGISWSAKTSGTSSQIFSLAYGNSLYVHAGAGGELQSSTDATTWNSRTSGTSSSILCMTYGTVYVYGGNGGVLSSSTDATTWNSRTSNTTSSIFCLAYGNGLYVYGGAGGVLASSTDATTWTARTSGVTSSITSVTYGNGRYFANFINANPSQNYGITSTDAITWTRIGLPWMQTTNKATCLYVNSSFYNLVSSIGSITSTDSLSWTRLSPIPVSGSMTPAYGGGKFALAASNSGAFNVLQGIYTSTDAVTWTSSPQNVGIQIISTLCYGNGKFAYGSQSGAICTSTDGITWVDQVSPLRQYTTQSYSGSTTNSINYLIYGSNRFFGILSNGSSIYNGIIQGNSTYSYDTSTQFCLPTDFKSPITTNDLNQFPRSLYIKT